MINHARTLLLNTSRESLSRIGLKPWEPWTVDPSFMPSEPEPCVDAVLSAMGCGSAIPDTADGILASADVVSCMTALAVSPDCRDLFSWLDWREEPVNSSTGKDGWRLRGMFSRVAVSKASSGVAANVAGLASLALFSKVGRKELDAVLAEAYPLAFGAFDGAVRFSAVVAGALVRLEAARLSSLGR